MPQPTSYNRSFSFTDDEASNPSGHVPGSSLDAEFDALTVTIKGVLTNLLKLQRDDGALKSQIVTLDSLSPAVMLALGAGVIWNPRGAWAAGTAYIVSDVVEEGTGTFVCAVPHVAADFTADRSKWVLLFDSNGVMPADGSVTSDKIADGAVLESAIGFTALTLTGYIGAAGFFAGTAPNDSLFHGKANAGDAWVKVERAATDQGFVGFRILDGSTTWDFAAAPGTGEVQIFSGGTVLATFDYRGHVAVPGAVRAVNGPFQTFGVGVALNYLGSIGYLTAYDYDASAWKDLQVRGKTITLTASGVAVIVASSTGVDFPKGLTNNGVSVGYLGIPQNEQDGAYTIQASDIGEDVYSENTVAQTITVPVLPAGSACTVTNDGTAPITLHGDGTTLRLTGTATTGDRTIGAGGMAFLSWKKDGTRVFVSGPGVS